MADRPKTIRETDDAARNQARLLMRGSRFGSIAVHDPQTGYPNCSRVLVGTAYDGVPVILVSRLSAHTKALLADTRASLLLGEPGKGDPLAHPRLTIQCNAKAVERESAEDGLIRARFIRRHKKADLYAAFADFLFFRLEPVSASLNGGFGKAYVLEPSDLSIDSDQIEFIAEHEEEILRLLKPVWKERAGPNPVLAAFDNWIPCAIDPEGVDLQKRDQLKRFRFMSTLTKMIDIERLADTIFDRFDRGD